MAYVTGTANSLADLLAAIQNACTANGWTLNGSVLHKGICCVEVKIVSTYIQVQGGTGIDGSANLTGRANTTAAKFAISPAFRQAGIGSPAFAFPVTYEVFIGTGPDEVYVVINYAMSFYETMAFGQSVAHGLTGTGNWYFGVYTNDYYSIETNGEAFSYGCAGIGLFARFGSGAYGVDHELDSAIWDVEGCYRDLMPAAMRQPNQWNGESILMPIRVYASRPSGFFAPVLECAHARHIVISNVTDGSIVTLGADRWKVYPWWSRGAAFYLASDIGKFSGQYGHAFRYDGP